MDQQQAIEHVRKLGYEVDNPDREEGPRGTAHLAEGARITYWIKLKHGYNSGGVDSYAMEIDDLSFAPLPGTHSSTFPVFLQGLLTEMPTPEQAFEEAKAQYPTQYEEEKRAYDEEVSAWSK